MIIDVGYKIMTFDELNDQAKIKAMDEVGLNTNPIASRLILEYFELLSTKLGFDLDLNETKVGLNLTVYGEFNFVNGWEDKLIGLGLNPDKDERKEWGVMFRAFNDIKVILGANPNISRVKFLPIGFTQSVEVFDNKNKIVENPNLELCFITVLEQLMKLCIANFNEQITMSYLEKNTDHYFKADGTFHSIQ